MQPPSPAEVLRAAREAAGLSSRELGARAGLAGTSVSAAERGRDVRHDTLQRLVTALRLDPAPLLGREAGGPRPASLSVWRLLTDGLGLCARRVTVSACADGLARGPVTLEVEGLRSARASLRDPAVREALMQAACEGTGALMRGLRALPSDLAGRPQRLHEPGAVHEIEFPSPLERRGLTYRRSEVAEETASPARTLDPPWGVPFSAGISAWLRYPCRRLDLVVRRAASCPPLVLWPRAWPAHVGPDGDEPLDLWPRLHPAWGPVPALLDGIGARLVVEHPALMTCYGLGFAPADESERRRLPSARRWTHARPTATERPRPVRLVLADARRRAGWTRRELARRMGTSPATVIGLESGGRTPRLSTLARAVTALPGLSPHAFLRPFDEDAPCTREEAWRWYRDLHALESEEEHAIVRVGRDGSLRYVARLLGLTWRPWGDHALRIRYGLEGARQGLAAPRLIAIRADAEGAGPTVRVVGRQPGTLLHEIGFEPGAAGRRVSYERVLAATRPLPMTEDLSPMVLFAAATLPTRRLRFELRFPRGLWPRRHVAGCSPAVMLPLKEGVEDLRERLYPDGWRLEEDVGAGVLSLVVERPLPGVTHAIGLWPLVPVGRPPRAAGTLGAAP